MKPALMKMSLTKFACAEKYSWGSRSSAELTTDCIHGTNISRLMRCGLSSSGRGLDALHISLVAAHLDLQAETQTSPCHIHHEWCQVAGPN